MVMKLQLQNLSHHVILPSTIKLTRACLHDQVVLASLNFRFWGTSMQFLLRTLAHYDFGFGLKKDLRYKNRSIPTQACNNA